MIAIACATTDELVFRAAGALVMEALDEGDSLLLRRHGCESVDGLFNDMLAAAADRDDLEAIVFVHQDTVVEPEAQTLARIRGLLATDGDVAVVGATEGGRPRDVAAVDGTLLALSPWAARALSFDPALDGAPDAGANDISLRARATGRRVLAAPLGATRVWAPRADREARQRQLRALVELRRKWEDEALEPL